jgi:phosphatidylglycerophosphatase A
MTPALWCALATIGPVGKMRPAPGSWGSLFGVVTGFGLASLSSGLLEIAILLAIIFGTIAANHHQSETGSKDASEVVIDEVAGQWIALLVIPLDWRWALAAFVLFRLFDITKIGPIGMVEKWPGGVGVMADDVIAGVFAALCLWLAQWFLLAG